MATQSYMEKAQYTFRCQISWIFIGKIRFSIGSSFAQSMGICSIISEWRKYMVLLGHPTSCLERATKVCWWLSIFSHIQAYMLLGEIFTFAKDFQNKQRWMILASSPEGALLGWTQAFVGILPLSWCSISILFSLCLFFHKQKWYNAPKWELALQSYSAANASYAFSESATVINLPRINCLPKIVRACV